MRFLPSNLSEKLSRTIQTRANNANPKADIHITRPTVPLTDERFLEQQEIETEGTLTDVSIAVSHPYKQSEVVNISVCYISDGIAKVSYAKRKLRIKDHNWINTDFSESADYISIAYDGKMLSDSDGLYEFVTDEYPWIAWSKDGTLYAYELYSNDPIITLAEENCTAVSLVRATWSRNTRFNYGLVAFFLLNGVLYYRQRIDGVWYDGEVVNVGLQNTWVDVAAFRTWDYRIGVQLIDSNGDTYDIFTQFMGIGIHSEDHIDVVEMSSFNALTTVHYNNAKTDEHFEVHDILNTTPYGGCYEIGSISFVDAWNDEDEDGNWDRIIKVKFDKEINLTQVNAQLEQFIFVDSNETQFYPTTATADSTGHIVSFIFASFNSEVGDITVSYTPGTVSSMYGEALPAFTDTFTPTGIVHPYGNPEVIGAWNE